jgi:site-specific DNA-methyltransferase (adenine-specific)
MNERQQAALDRANAMGRWPANVVLTDPIFDGHTPGVVGGGEQSGGGNPQRRNVGDGDRAVYRDGWYGDETGLEPADTAGTYSRFFLIPKADRSEREPAVRGQLTERQPPSWSSGEQSPGTFQSQPTPPRENVHPTVKPVDLMRHLVRLVTPPGGTVLDPFLGSGTTAIAAELEGFPWIGIEREPEYVAIAEARLNGIQRGMGLDTELTSPRKPSKSHWPKARPAGKAGWGFSGQTGLDEHWDPPEPAEEAS